MLMRRIRVSGKRKTLSFEVQEEEAVSYRVMRSVDMSPEIELSYLERNQQENRSVSPFSLVMPYRNRSGYVLNITDSDCQVVRKEDVSHALWTPEELKKHSLYRMLALFITLSFHDLEQGVVEELVLDISVHHRSFDSILGEEYTGLKQAFDYVQSLLEARNKTRDRPGGERLVDIYEKYWTQLAKNLHSFYEEIKVYFEENYDKPWIEVEKEVEKLCQKSLGILTGICGQERKGDTLFKKGVTVAGRFPGLLKNVIKGEWQKGISLGELHSHKWSDFRYPEEGDFRQNMIQEWTELRSVLLKRGVMIAEDDVYTIFHILSASYYHILSHYHLGRVEEKRWEGFKGYSFFDNVGKYLQSPKELLLDILHKDEDNFVSLLKILRCQVDTLMVMDHGCETDQMVYLIWSISMGIYRECTISLESYQEHIQTLMKKITLFFDCYGKQAPSDKPVCAERSFVSYSVVIFYTSIHQRRYFDDIETLYRSD